jgi:hypothetical protein
MGKQTKKNTKNIKLRKKSATPKTPGDGISGKLKNWKNATQILYHYQKIDKNV